MIAMRNGCGGGPSVALASATDESRRESAAPGTKSESRYSRSEEHTSELQSLAYLVCRLLLEKKKKKRSGVGAGELIGAYRIAKVGIQFYERAILPELKKRPNLRQEQ